METIDGVYGSRALGYLAGILESMGAEVSFAWHDEFPDILTEVQVTTLDGTEFGVENSAVRDELSDAYWFEDQRRYADGLWRE